MGRNCSCQNPWRAKRRRWGAPPPKKTRWDFAFEVTKELAANATEQKPKLVLLGDSITEHWTGMRMGRLVPKFANHAAVFKEILTKEGGGKFDSVPLAISGDRVSGTRMYMRPGVPLPP
jgi:hypothetical protein